MKVANRRRREVSRREQRPCLYISPPASFWGNCGSSKLEGTLDVPTLLDGKSTRPDCDTSYVMFPQL